MAPFDSDTLLIDQFVSSLNVSRPWESIVDFAVHSSFCNMRLYPRQLTLLKLIMLETENMSSYDEDVIEEWREKGGVQDDVWERVKFLKENGFDHFPTVLAVQGRRASKGLIGGILGTERIARLVSLDDPQLFFSIAPGKSLFLQVVATNLLQAKKFLFADVRQTVESCAFLQPHIVSSGESSLSLATPADTRHRSLLLPSSVKRDVASIQVEPVSSVSSSTRGGSSFCLMFDEMAHMLTGTSGLRTSEEVFEAATPSLDQCGPFALTYIPSSPYTKVGKFYELYKQGCLPLNGEENDETKQKVEQLDSLPAWARSLSESSILDGSFDGTVPVVDPEMLVVQLPSWELYRDWEDAKSLVGYSFSKPIQYPPDPNGPVESQRMHRLELSSPERFRVERRAQFAEVQSGYLDPKLVDKMYRLSLPLKDRGQWGIVYQGHADPSKSNANFALAIGHLVEGSELYEEVSDSLKSSITLDSPHVVFDLLRVFRPQDFLQHQVDYLLIEKEIERLFTMFPSLKSFTFDQWNSAGPISHLRQFVSSQGLSTSVSEVNFNASRNFAVAESFKTAVGMGVVHVPRDNFLDGDCLLSNELKFLVEKNGRIEKQEIGPVRTKDLADCVMQVTVSLLESHSKVKVELPVLSGRSSSGVSTMPSLSRLKPSRSILRGGRFG